MAYHYLYSLRSSNQACTRPLLRAEELNVNAFDKTCAALAFVLGIVFLLIGIFGVFIGCRASFSLPPLVGVIPAFAGWGIVRAVYVAWNQPTPPPGWNQHIAVGDSYRPT
jgi:hypothetical protein